MTKRNICPYCFKEYTPYHLKQKACGNHACQLQRIYDQRRELAAKKADARQHAFEVGRKRWISRKRNMKLMEVAA